MSGMLVAPLLHLRTAPALEGLGQPYLEALAREAEEVLLPRGTVVLSHTDPAQALHVIVDGALGRAGAPAEAVAGPGDTVGFLEVLAGWAAPAPVVADVDTVALRLDGEVLRDLLERHMPILVHFLAEVAARTLARPDARRAACRGGDPPRPLKPGMNRVDRILALHRSPAFPSGNMDALAELAGHARETTFGARKQFLGVGTPASSFLVVCAGSVTYGDSTAKDRGSLGPGGVPGFLEIFGGGVRSTEAVAQTEVVALEIDRESFLDVLEDHFEMAWTILANLSQGLLILDGAEQRSVDPQSGGPST